MSDKEIRVFVNLKALMGCFGVAVVVMLGAIAGVWFGVFKPQQEASARATQVAQAQAASQAEAAATARREATEAAQARREEEERNGNNSNNNDPLPGLDGL